MTTPTAPDPDQAATRRSTPVAADTTADYWSPEGARAYSAHPATPAAKPAPAAHGTAGPRYPFTAETDLPAASAATSPAAHTRGWSVALRITSFVIGCAIVVWCAWALTARIPRWSADYGHIPVFLGYFLLISIGGRWFWMGIDTALRTVIHGRD